MDVIGRVLRGQKASTVVELLHTYGGTRVPMTAALLGSGAPGEVGGLDLVELAHDFLGRAAQHDAPALHHVDAIGDLERLADVLLDEEHADAPLVRRVADRLRGGWRR